MTPDSSPLEAPPTTFFWMKTGGNNMDNNEMGNQVGNTEMKLLPNSLFGGYPPINSLFGGADKLGGLFGADKGGGLFGGDKGFGDKEQGFFGAATLPASFNPPQVINYYIYKILFRSSLKLLQALSWEVLLISLEEHTSPLNLPKMHSLPLLLILIIDPLPLVDSLQARKVIYTRTHTHTHTHIYIYIYI